MNQTASNNIGSNSSLSFEQFNSYDPYFTNNEGNELFLALAKPEIVQDPYPYYHYLYSKGPINWLPDKTRPSKGYYMVHDYSIIEELFKSSKVGNDDAHLNWSDEQRTKIEKLTKVNPYIRMVNHWLINLDPPEHTKNRSIMNKVFTPKRVRELNDPIYNLANSLVNDIKDKNTFNLLTDFAYPFPILVIASLLGVPSNDLNVFKKWANTLLVMFKQEELNQQERNLLNKDVLEMQKFFAKLLQEKRKNPSNDLISDLVMNNDSEIPQETIIDHLIGLLFAGHETTKNLIANGAYHLLKHPDQISLLQNDSSLYPNAVEEALRYDAPVQYDFRYSYDDFDFNGSKIKPGFPIGMMIGSANRNESSNPDPDSFDITRKNIKHLSFARGVHYCLGAPLARLEGKIAFETLFTSFKNLQLAEQPKYRIQPGFRGLESLMVKI